MGEGERLETRNGSKGHDDHLYTTHTHTTIITVMSSIKYAKISVRVSDSVRKEEGEGVYFIYNHISSS